VTKYSEHDWDLTIWLDAKIIKVNEKIEKLTDDRDKLVALRQIMWDKKN
jgi:hypothetical protein